MGLLRDIHAALREGLDDLLNAGSSHDDIEEVTGLLESDLAEARTELDTARDEARRLAARVEGERRSAERLHEQAQAAVEQGDDEQGRELIRKRRRVLRGVEILEQQQAEHRQMIELLRDHIETLEDKLQELRLRSDYLRTRNRVQSLRERFDRYLREYGLAEIPSLEESLADAELSGPPGGGEVRCAWCNKTQEQVDRMFAGPDGLHICSDCVTNASELLHEPEAPPTGEERVVPEGPLTPRRRRQRLESDEAPEPAPLPRGGRAEVPGEPEPEPALRRRELEEEPEPEPRRSTRAERESLLREIEQRQRGPEFEAELDDELARMKAALGQPATAPPPDGEAPAPAPAPPADEADEPARKTEPPPAEDEHGGEQ